MIPTNSNFDSRELADKIRQIYTLKSRSPPEITLDSHDEEEIRQLYCKVCEPTFLQLLMEVGAVQQLHMFICSYVTTLNTLVMGIDKLELSNSQRSQLEEKIKLRRTLFEAHWFGEDEMSTSDNETTKCNELLDAICSHCSNVEVFRALPYKQLKDDYLDRSTKEQHRILQTLWIGDDNLRILVEKYKLPLFTIDWLNQQNITNIETITPQQVNDIIQLDLKQAKANYEKTNDNETKQHISDVHDEFKANLMHLYHIETIKRHIEYKKNIQQQSERVDQAIKELSSIKRIEPTTREMFGKLLTDIGSSLGVNWHFSNEEISNTTELIDIMIQDLYSIRKGIPTDNEYQPDEELVACLNDNAALFGVQLMEPSKKVFRPLLSRPIYAPLGEPMIRSSVKEFTFSSLNDSEQFIQTIITSGLAAAVHMQSKFTGPSSDISAKRTITNLDPTKFTLVTDTSAQVALLIKKSILGAKKTSMSSWDQNTLQRICTILERFGWSTTQEEFSSPLDENGIFALVKQMNEAISNSCLLLDSKPNADLLEPVTIKQIQTQSTDHKRKFSHRYSDWAIDRPLASNDKPIKRLIDILRHRLDIKLFTSVTSSHQSSSNNTKALARNLLMQTTSQNLSPVNATAYVPTSSPGNTAYDALIQLVDTSDVLSQVELFRLLFERRSPVPILTPTRSNPPFFYYAKPLTFASVKLSTENYCNLGSNTTLYRIAIISMRRAGQSESVEFLKQVFACNSLAPSSSEFLKCLPENSCIAEMGVGFCPKMEHEGGDNQSIFSYNEVLVLHVIGNYISIFSYIHDFADLIIVESHSSSSNEYNPPIPVKDSQKVIIWKSASSAREPYVSPKRYICLKSTIAQARSHIHAIIDDLTNQTGSMNRISVQDIKHSTLYEIDSINWINVENEVKNHNYLTVRRYELLLQQLFAKEVEYLRSKTKAQTAYAEREKIDCNIRECQRRRQSLAPAMYQHSLIKCFVGILSQTNDQVRTVGMCQFVKHLEFYSKKALQELSRNQQEAHEALNNDSQNKEKREAYYEAKRVYANSLITIEHLWRELSHIYVSNKTRYANLPILAAQHLLDGFSLELLDGDAGMLEQSWFNAVFKELNTILTKKDKDKGPCRIFVLSVMGVQSSGKSTLLNLMFGTRLRASAGMCTRGVNIQLLKAEDRSEYDYVLILDSEGVRAPEFSGLEGATWRDNRLATFSILPADATIIMINNEEDTAAREVLPIVMLAYQQSELAAKSTNQLKTKLFFVYTRIDTNEKSKLTGIAQSLSLELRKAAADLEHDQHHGTKESNNDEQNLASELLHDFQTTDIQFLGKLKVRDKPPEDIPEFDYGHDIVKLNAYIYYRLTKSSPRWQARELSNCIYISLTMNVPLNEIQFKINSEDKMFDTIIKHNIKDNKIVYSSFIDLLPKELREDDPYLKKPSEEELRKVNHIMIINLYQFLLFRKQKKIRQALEVLVSSKVSIAIPIQHAKKQTPVQYIHYTPSQQGPTFNSGAKQRIIQMVEVQKDPMEPSRFKINKKIPRGSPSPLVPILHSPKRKITVEDQENWKIPPCISNWKNAKGYTIPLDKRLATDGRALQNTHINENFAKLAEAINIAEFKAHEAINMRAKVEKQIAKNQKEEKEEQLRELARRARTEQAGQRSINKYDDQSAERDQIRQERQKDRQHDAALQRAGGDKQ
ncbi:unnamed protein product [Rotaria sp. Silwood1]|nr:unnamed protein product [Rotaria sp. Silwood1]